MTGDQESEVTGIILVGGQSRRMGRDKCFLELDGKSMFQRILDAFRDSFSRVCLVGNRAERFAHLGLEVLPDIYPGSALGGIYTGLYHAATPYVFASSCDIPFPNREVIRALCARRKGADAVVVRRAQGVEPLFALYGKECLPPIRRLLESGDCCAYRYYPEVRVSYVPYEDLALLDPDGRAFLNINTPEQYAAIGGEPWA